MKIDLCYVCFIDDGNRSNVDNKVFGVMIIYGLDGYVFGLGY